MPVPGLSALEARVAALEAGPPVAGSPYVTPSGGDDTQMLNDLAADAADTDTGVLRLEGRFQASEPVVLRCHVDALGADLVSSASVGIQVGLPGVNLFNKTMRLPRVMAAGSEIDPGAVGLKMVAVKQSEITANVYRFGKALFLSVSSAYLLRNSLRVSALDYNEGGGATIRIEGYSNGMTFLNPSVEGADLEWMIDCNGPYNTFLQPRTERYGTPARVRFRGYGYGNTVVGGYGAGSVEIVEEGDAVGQNTFVGDYQIAGYKI